MPYTGSLLSIVVYDDMLRFMMVYDYSLQARSSNPTRPFERVPPIPAQPTHTKFFWIFYTIPLTVCLKVSNGTSKTSLHSMRRVVETFHKMAR